MIAAPPIAAQAAPAQDETIATADLYRLTLDQYKAMIDHAILGDEDRVELLEGLLIRKMIKKRPHSFSTHTLRELLFAMLSAEFYVDSQEPFNAVNSQPEPDLMVVRGKPQDFPDDHPSAQAIALVGEVSYSTLQQDRGVKLRLYARASIPVYWIVNLVDGQIEVCTQPDGAGRYAQMTVYRGDDQVPVVIDNQTLGSIRAGDVLPAHVETEENSS